MAYTDYSVVAVANVLRCAPMFERYPGREGGAYLAGAGQGLCMCTYIPVPEF